MRTFLLALFIALALGGEAQAKFITAELLFENLNSVNCEKNNGARGYILGVYDSFEGTLYAQHPSLTEDDLVRIVEDYIRARPTQRHFSAQYAVMRALERHFAATGGERDAPQ